MNRYPQRQGDRGPGQGRGREPRGASGPALSPDDARRIVEGDAKLLVERAKNVAQELRDEASRTQLRRLYGEVKRIEMLWRGAGQSGEKDTEAQRRVLLLKPRLAYQVARQSKLQGLQRTIEPVIDAVGADKARFQRFVEFFEAIVAYAR
jgi:CRISPR-associated protein Csm2